MRLLRPRPPRLPVCAVDKADRAAQGGRRSPSRAAKTTGACGQQQADPAARDTARTGPRREGPDAVGQVHVLAAAEAEIAQLKEISTQMRQLEPSMARIRSSIWPSRPSTQGRVGVGSLESAGGRPAGHGRLPAGRRRQGHPGAGAGRARLKNESFEHIKDQRSAVSGKRQARPGPRGGWEQEGAPRPRAGMAVTVDLGD